ncbi:MAG TPA: hypothetical protein PKX79_08445 [Spirochaetota bacterium]|nr:hypothetical protein [Spirochaetota bacterium]
MTKKIISSLILLLLCSAVFAAGSSSENSIKEKDNSREFCGKSTNNCEDNKEKAKTPYVKKKKPIKNDSSQK